MEHCATLDSNTVQMLAGMAQLRQLVLHQPSNLSEFDLDSDDEFDFPEKTWFSCIGSSLAKLTTSTRLEVPFGVPEPQQGLLQQLPAGLRELRLGTDVGSITTDYRARQIVDGDGGALEFGFQADCVQVREKLPSHYSTHVPAV
jgi:hypothetical protein